MAVLPLQVGARQVGVLVLMVEEGYEFTENEKRLYRSITPQVAVAADNQRLLFETRAALAEVEATQRRYTVQAWEAYQNRVVSLKHEQAREGITPLGDNLPPEVEQAVTRKQVVVTTSLPTSLAGGQEEEVNHQTLSKDIKSSLIVPLTVHGETIGVLGIQETDGTGSWSPEEIALVEAISAQLAQAAERIRLLDETQQRAAREKRVNEIGEKIQATQSLEEALRIAVREVGLSLQAPQTTVQLEVK